jgi:hypothetical protein
MTQQAMAMIAGYTLTGEPILDQSCSVSRPMARVGAVDGVTVGDVEPDNKGGTLG